jgi:uncharacterized repeat protein (TIGR03803 family)
VTATLTTLVGFNGANGVAPDGSLIADSNGDLFGTTSEGGANNDGTVFEIAKTAGGYASTPTTLVSFNGADGGFPVAGLLADAHGDLFGTTFSGGASDLGTVFEIAKAAGGYASTPATLVSFNGADGAEPVAGLIADASGDLFGGTTDQDVAKAEGTVFEIAKTATGYASAPTTVVSFNGADGSIPEGRLFADANGDLFGTTEQGGASGDGTVFEIAKTAAGYVGTPTTLVSFNGTDGALPVAGLIADSRGDLFGTTRSGGANNEGSVFEIAKTAGGYASTPTTLASFNGSILQGNLIVDANGNLFGTTQAGGAHGDGTVFEIKKTAAGYASTPTTLVSFDFDNGFAPIAGLIADAAGDLFGTTAGDGASNDGTVFEITDSGFVPPIPPISPTVINDILLQNVSGQAAIWDVSGATLTSSALLGANPGPNWKDVGTGDFNADAHPDVLLQNTNGAVAIWETSGTAVTSSAVVANPGPNWKAVGTGDFSVGGHSDILLQNTNGAVAIWNMNGTDLTSSAVVANPGPNWKVVGTGDFNDDGHSDILLQNTTNGNVAIWEMNGTDLMSSAAVASPGASWKVVGTGDFNGDSHSDILLQNTNGNVAIWEMNGTGLMSSAAVANPGANWHAIGTNGGSDILLQNTSGQTALWDMSGTHLTGSGAVSANAGPNWRAVGLT